MIKSKAPINDNYENMMSVINSWKRLGIETLPAGTERIGHIPHRAPMAYLHSVFPGLNESQILQMENEIGRSLPESVKDFYRRHNGLELFNLIGIDGARAHYDRYAVPSSLEQPFDIRLPNILERPVNAPEEVVFVGGLTEEGILVFAKHDGSIGFWDKKKQAVLPRSFKNIWRFLLEAVKVADAQFDEKGRHLGGNLLSVVELQH